MEIVHVAGEDRGEIMLYTLSTCVWCRKMKRWLDEKGFAYSYVDVDLEYGDEKEGSWRKLSAGILFAPSPRLSLTRRSVSWVSNRIDSWRS